MKLHFLHITFDINIQSTFSSLMFEWGKSLMCQICLLKYSIHKLTFLRKTKRKIGGKKMSRGKNYNHKVKGHPGEFPKNSVVPGKDHNQYGKPIENIIPEETFKNRVKEE